MQESYDINADREIAEAMQGTYNWLRWTGQLAEHHKELDEDTDSVG